MMIIEYQVRPHQCEGGSWWQSWEFQSVAARSAGGSNNNDNNNNNNNSGQNNNNRINSLDNFPDISVVVASFGGLVKIPAWLETGNKRFYSWYFFFLTYLLVKRDTSDPVVCFPPEDFAANLIFKEKTWRKMLLYSPSWTTFSQQKGEKDLKTQAKSHNDW